MGKDFIKEQKEKLEYTNVNGFEAIDAEEEKKIFDFSEDYKKFLDESKTEREAVEFARKIIEKEGFVPFEYGRKYESGDKIFYNNRGKSIVMAIIGKRPIDYGMLISAAHIDSPRLDVKQNPLYEDSDLGFFKTHYYGGIKKYQWPTIPLSLHGVIVKENGEKVTVRYGEEADEPVFYITDILPHLGKDQMSKTLGSAIEAEKLNVLIGSRPIEKGEENGRVKLEILRILNEKYGIKEEDFITSELTFTPAFSARDVGFDRSFIGSYGHDDRVCAYPEFRALLDFKGVPEKTIVCVFADKEEVGSDGNTGFASNFFYDFATELALSNGANPRKMFSLSKCLSADVNAGFDPNYAEVYEKKNASFVNCGVVVTKFTGHGGKSGTSDASAEYFGELRRIFNEEKVIWQYGELGKVDQGGGGTVAKFLAKLNIDTIDVGVPVLSMHAPYEVVSKLDVYSTYKAILAFYKRA